MDSLSSTCIEKVGAKDVTIRSTGHEKMRITVMLTARANGTKCKPYILIPRKRPVKEVEQKIGSRAIVKYEGTSWMNTSLTVDFIKRSLGRSLFGRKRLLVWDSFKAHLTEETSTLLRNYNIFQAVVPGGCTKYIQAPDVCWNKPVKDRIGEEYDEWLETGPQELTRGGNPKPPPFETVIEWILKAWDSLSNELIEKSFKTCGITNKADGSEDNLIECFRPGRGCHEGLKLLSEKSQALPTLEQDEPEPEMSFEESDDEIVENDTGK